MFYRLADQDLGRGINMNEKSQSGDIVLMLSKQEALKGKYLIVFLIFLKY